MTEANDTMTAPEAAGNDDAELLAMMRDAPPGMRRLIRAAVARLRANANLDAPEAMRLGALDLENECDPEAWREVHLARGPGDAIVRTLGKARDVETEVDGFMDVLHMLAGQKSDIDPDTLGTIALALNGHTDTLMEAVREAEALARPLAHAERKAAEAARKQSLDLDAAGKLRTAARLAKVAADMRAEARAEMRAKRAAKHVNGAAAA